MKRVAKTQKNVEYKVHLRTPITIFSNHADTSESSAIQPPGCTWAKAYILLSGAINLLYTIIFARRHSPWPLGDWLINYEGGFVRRGLIGQMLLLASPLLHLSLVQAAACAQVACVMCTTICLLPLVKETFRNSSSLWGKALLFSPATLAFVWLDPTLALHKEILLFALLALLITLLRRRKPLSEGWLTALLCISLPVLILSHEGLVCFTPYICAAVLLGRRSVNRGMRICAVPALLSLAALIAAFRHHGDLRVSEQVCKSVGGQVTGLCWGPIWYLGASGSSYRDEVTRMMQDSRLLCAISITTVLALLPVAAALWDFWRKPITKDTRIVLPLAYASALATSIPLFLETQDWGRWIYIHVMCSLLLLFFALSLREEDHNSAHSQPWRRKQATIALLFYATMWNLPALGEHAPLGYMKLLWRTTHHVHEASNVSQL